MPATSRRAATALLVLGVLVGSGAVPASAAPPERRVVRDGATPGVGLDVRRVVLLSAPGPGAAVRARVVLGRPARAGDTLDVYWDTDGDRGPEVRYSGAASSGFQSWRMRTWQQRGRALDTRCGRLVMVLDEQVAVARFLPRCLDDDVRRVRVSVRARSTAPGAPAGIDWVPGRKQWSGAVRAVAQQPD